MSSLAWTVVRCTASSARSATVLAIVLMFSTLTPLVATGSEFGCWPEDPAEEARCCNFAGASRSDSGCWEAGRLSGTCCLQTPVIISSEYILIAAAILGLLVMCACDARHWQLRRSEQGARRLRKLQERQHEFDATQPGRASEGAPHFEVAAAADRTAAEDRIVGEFPDKALDASGPKPATEDCASSAGPEMPLAAQMVLPAVSEFAESPLLCIGEEPLLEVLGALDGIALARWECLSLRARHGSVRSLAGLWRLVHVRALGGRPPATLARAPAGTSSSGQAAAAAGAWKAWWAWRRSVLAQSDDARHAAAARLAKALLKLPLPGFRGEPAGLQAELSPMKPSEAWIGNLLLTLQEELGTDFSFVADDRLAPLPWRWHCHVLVAGEAALADAQNFHTDLLRLFASWSCCFSAAAGQPRFYYALVRHIPADELWEVEVFHCRVPARHTASWVMIAEEITEVLASGRSLASALCGATRICRLEFFGADWLLQQSVMAPTAELELIGKELFGAKAPARYKERCSSMADYTLALAALEWLLVATCPNPFSEAPRALRLASQQLAGRL